MANDIDAALATNRFGLGARPGEIAQAAGDPRGWLKAQIRSDGADRPAEPGLGTVERLALLRTTQRAKLRPEPSAHQGCAAERLPADGMVRRRMLGATFRPTGAPGGATGDAKPPWQGDIDGRLRLAAMTPASFRERWALFFMNHFTVSGLAGVTVRNLTGPFELEAVRPNVFASFETLLLAASRHPAMLMYLDQAPSVGPNSIAGRRPRRPGRSAGLNENLAREILELHTVGVEAMYAQEDVTELARALTGWSTVDRAPSGGAGAAPVEALEHGFLFREAAHEPGRRQVLGRTYAEGGAEQGVAILRDLAADPRTAHHVCTKLARHFVADAPDPQLVARLERAWRDSDGSLAEVAVALIEAPEAWSPVQRKFKTPYEFLVSSWRAIGGDQNAAPPPNSIQLLASLGQRPLAAPSPAGWSDAAETWASPGAMIKRLVWAEAYADARGARVSPSAVGRRSLGPLLTPDVAGAMERVANRSEALAVLFMSPEFQRR